MNDFAYILVVLFAFVVGVYVGIVIEGIGRE